MNIEKKLLKEIEKFNTIKEYINEQESGDSDPLGDLGIDDTEVETDTEVENEPVDLDTDPDVEVVGDTLDQSTDSESGTEELDITDLVTKQEDILTKLGNIDDIFTKLNDLTDKLGEMDQIISKIDNVEAKIEKYKPKSPEQKLELRSLDSYPYNQKLTDFFDDKGEEMEKMGKSEYVLTQDDVENFSDKDIKDSFDIVFDEDQ